MEQRTRRRRQGRGAGGGSRLSTRTGVRLGALTLGVGATFPWIAPLLGMASAQAHGPGFAVACGTGVLVGLAGALVLRRVVSPPLVSLAADLTAIADAVRTGASREALRGLRVEVPADGELAQVARAVNTVVDALEAERGFRSIVEASGDLVLVLDAAGCITFASDSLGAILGRGPDQVLGRPLAGLVHTGDLEGMLDLLELGVAPETVPVGGELRRRLRMRADDDSWRVLDLMVTARHDRALGAALVIGRDVTDQVELEAELLRQATHDTLTGLPNRKALMETATEVVASATKDRPVAVLMIDLDRFKVINDSLGHAFGDQLLAQVGPRLRSILRPSDTIVRLGGDEFAVLLPTAGVKGARLVAERLAAQLDDPFVVEGMDLHVDASIGIAVSHRGTEVDTIETLLRDADIAMYRAKEAGGGMAVFDPQRDAQNSSRLELSAELRRAISDDQLVLHYQPVVDIIEGRLAGVEALVRWQHPVHGLRAPAMFLPLAEETGLIVPLSRAVVELAVAQAAQWAADGHPLQIAVNLSPRWLQHEDVPDVVAATLARHGVPPQLLRLEITESVVFADREERLPMLVRLRDMGIGLSLDDFGTGYSSMTHLRSLPVDELKVDRAFVQAMTTTPEDAVIVRAAIELGRNLGLAVVAEGIEDADTLAEIVGSGCQLAQGYYFAPPLPPRELEAWAREHFPSAEPSEARAVTAAPPPAPRTGSLTLDAAG